MQDHGSGTVFALDDITDSKKKGAAASSENLRHMSHSGALGITAARCQRRSGAMDGAPGKNYPKSAFFAISANETAYRARIAEGGDGNTNDLNFFRSDEDKGF
jgi:hypothetical protein